jgi:hypothetical protein
MKNPEPGVGGEFVRPTALGAFFERPRDPNHGERDPILLGLVVGDVRRVVEEEIRQRRG